MVVTYRTENRSIVQPEDSSNNSKSNTEGNISLNYDKLYIFQQLFWVWYPNYVTLLIRVKGKTLWKVDIWAVGLNRFKFNKVMKTVTDDYIKSVALGDSEGWTVTGSSSVTVHFIWCNCYIYGDVGKCYWYNRTVPSMKLTHSPLNISLEIYLPKQKKRKDWTKLAFFPF